MKWFQSGQSVGDIKRTYRDLAKKYHPDVAGADSTKAMQEINAEYLMALQGLDGQESLGSDNKTHTYRYNRKAEEAVMSKVGEILALHMPNTSVEIIGTWIWIWGDTKPFKAQLGKGGAKCRWHSKRQKWYWHGASYRRSYSGVDFETMRGMYGSRVFESEERTMVGAQA